MDNYPIEIGVPNITEFELGNTGVPYVWRWDSCSPGPVVMISALTHGNEICGAQVLVELLKAELRPTRGSLVLAFSNVHAFNTFEMKNPDKSRFVDEDFNRVWSSERLESSEGNVSLEVMRARELRSLIDQVDFLLDIHSMHEKCAPLLLSGPTNKGLKFAQSMGWPRDIIVDQGHKEGRRLRDYGEFNHEDSDKNALLIECGQHWEKGVIEAARSITGRFLLQLGIIDESALPMEWPVPTLVEQRAIVVTEAVVANSYEFVFVDEYFGLETIPYKGTVIAYDDGEAVVTPYDECILVMPSLRQLRPGVTVVRFGYIA
jgi:predicted deacylase